MSQASQSPVTMDQLKAVVLELAKMDKWITEERYGQYTRRHLDDTLEELSFLPESLVEEVAKEVLA